MQLPFAVAAQQIADRESIAPPSLNVTKARLPSRIDTPSVKTLSLKSNWSFGSFGDLRSKRYADPEFAPCLQP